MPEASDGQLRVAVGSARYLPHDRVLDVDDRHPLQQGALQLDLTVADGVITGAEPRIGFVHRSAEKLFESRDYRQIMMLANRHDWLSSFHGELCIALTAESALGITPPALATWSRTLLAELNRMNVGLHFLGTSLRTHPEIQAATLVLRERILHLYERASGSRIHPMINRIGGLAYALDTDLLDDMTAVTHETADHLPPLRAALEAEFAGLDTLAPVTAEQVAQFGLSGPVARSAGSTTDLRRDAPYLAYGELEEFLPVDEIPGGVLGRHLALHQQLVVSTRLLHPCIEQVHALTGTPIDVPLPKVVRLPESETYGQIEGPIGVTGALIVSRGDSMPWRLKLNTPSFHTMHALTEVLIGVPLAELSPVMASMYVVVGDIDR